MLARARLRPRRAARRAPQNVFDFLIVSISWLSMYADQLPGIGVLRLFRAFRVFRLFRRVRSLRLIIEGVLASMPGVSNAFVVLVLLMGARGAGAGAPFARRGGQSVRAERPRSRPRRAGPRGRA